jgi:outer membrane protein assembly factor BamB
MRRLLSLAAAVFVVPFLTAFGGEKTPETSAAGPISVAATDWAWWRGPNLNGVANAEQTPPVQWSEEENVLWKVPVPGRGHSSPTICGDRIFLATAETEPAVQSVICYDRQTGEQLWKSVVHTGGLSLEGLKAHPKASLASSTVACDGERLFINFFNANAIYTTALDMKGNKLWQRKVTDYTMHQGFGSSRRFTNRWSSCRPT